MKNFDLGSRKYQGETYDISITFNVIEDDVSENPKDEMVKFLIEVTWNLSQNGQLKKEISFIHDPLIVGSSEQGPLKFEEIYSEIITIFSVMIGLTESEGAKV